MKVPNRGDRVRLIALNYLTLIGTIDKVKAFNEDAKTWNVSILVDDGTGGIECIDNKGLTHNTPEAEIKEVHGSIQWELVK